MAFTLSHIKKVFLNAQLQDNLNVQPALLEANRTSRDGCMQLWHLLLITLININTYHNEN